MRTVEDSGRALSLSSLILVNCVEGRTWWLIPTPEKRKKEESERLRGDGDQIKLIDLRFEGRQVVGLSELR